MNSSNSTRRLASRLATVAIAYLFLLGLTAVYAWPFWPQTYLGWLLFLLFGPALFLVVEAAGEKLNREPMGRWVDTRTSEHRFSVTRVLYLLIKSVLVLGVIGGIIWAAHFYVPGVEEFLYENFGPMSNPLA
jgi:hypothetical protein